jgi:AraC family transcriptional regulator
MDDITLVEVKEQVVLGTRKRGAYQELATIIPVLYQYAGSKGAIPLGPPIFICHAKSKADAMEASRAGNADLEIAVPVAAQAPAEGDISCYTLPGGTMARIVHKGPYEACEPTYTRLFAWLKEQGKKVTGPVREIYISDPRTVAPEDLLTEIYAPVE